MTLLQPIDLTRKPRMKDQIRDVHDFPKTGIVFKDIFPLLENCFTEVIDDLSRKIENPKSIDYIVGIESRGFIFAASLAYKLNKGFIPIRKKGKLPAPTLSEEVSMEYGETEIEMAISENSISHHKVIIVDDVIATGETLCKAWRLVTRVGFTPVQALALINLKTVNKKNFQFPVKYLFEYRDEE